MPVLRKAASSISMGPANEIFKQKATEKSHMEQVLSLLMNIFLGGIMMNVLRLY
jgi:hypothetical protein